MHSHLRGHPALVHAIKRLEQRNPDQFELYFEKKTSTKFDAKDQQIDSLTQAQDQGVAIRVLKDKRMGFSFTTSMENSAIDRAVESAFEISALMPEDEFNGLFSFGSAVYPNVDAFDAKGLKVPVSQKIEMAKSLESLCKKADSRINNIRHASLGETIYEVHLVDSNGEYIHHQQTVYTSSITCKAEQNGDNQMGGDFGFSNYLDNLDIAGIAQEAARTATELLGAGTAPTLKCPAVLRNSVVAELIEFLSSSFSAESIERGRSMLAGKKDQMIFSEAITLVDDGLLPGGFATSPFDGEGVPSQKINLVENGFFSGILYDTYYAKKSKMDPTGSAVRGIKGPPSIGFSNLFIKPGKKTPLQLFDGIRKGILITDLMGVHTANPITGEFSLGASGILIENGKLTKPVRGFAVAGNVLELFRKMTDISNDLKFFGQVGAPSVRVSELSVGGA